MRKEDLFNTMNDIDNKYLEIADKYEGKSKGAHWGKLVATAACLCVVVGAASIMPSFIEKSEKDNPSKIVSQGVEEKGDLENMDSNTEVKPSSDKPAKNEVESLNAYDEVWGGSYVDDSGKWIVWLTNNTEENQKMVLDKNTNLSGKDITFKKADYSLAYLNEVMDSINDGMKKGDLPFVTGAMILEQNNRVEVFLNTKNTDLEKQVLALDEKGGAIVIGYSDEDGVEDLGKASNKTTKHKKSSSVDKSVKNEIENLNAYDEIWGGSYVDDSGKWIVWLTNNTEENQKVVLNKNPNISGKDVTFKKAKHSLAYLNEVMDSINKKMKSGELAFVTGAMLVEKNNCIEVYMNTNDADLEKQVLALDKKGGAIVINQSGDDGVEDLGSL